MRRHLVNGWSMDIRFRPLANSPNRRSCDWWTPAGMQLPGDAAAVHDEGLAGDEGGAVGGEVDEGADEVGR